MPLTEDQKTALAVNAAGALGHAIAALRLHLPAFRAGLRPAKPEALFSRIMNAGLFSPAQREAVDEAMRPTLAAALALVEAYDRDTLTTRAIMAGDHPHG